MIWLASWGAEIARRPPGGRSINPSAANWPMSVEIRDLLTPIAWAMPS